MIFVEETKRKTRTSSAVKNRYNAKVYGSVKILVDKTLVENFKAKCKQNGVSQAQILKKAMEDYLKEA